jgi:hypothetical protein
VTSTANDKGIQFDPTAAAARDTTVPAHGAGQDRSQAMPYPKLADRVATDGPAALEHELRRLIRDARRHRVTPLLVTILADRSQPDIARQRAFGRVLAELACAHDTRPHQAHTEDDAA